MTLATRSLPPLPAAMASNPPSPEQRLADRTTQIRNPRYSARRRRGSKADNRFIILNEFVDCTMATVSATEALVWFVLYRDVRDGIATTSQSEIARRIGKSERQVRRLLNKLIESGTVSIIQRGGKGRPSRYRVMANRGHSDGK
jgi:DNA-binding MarR family transcriptional regulator